MCVGSSKGKQNLSSCFTGFGFPPARGEILDHKTSAQHKFLGVKSTLDPGFGIRYEHDVLYVNGEEQYSFRFFTSFSALFS